MLACRHPPLNFRCSIRRKLPSCTIPAVNPANNTRSAYDPIANTYRPANYIGLMIPGSGNITNGICQAGTCVNKYLTKDRGLQWGPRFGVAWDITGKQDLVIRTGGGIYYDRIQGNRTFDTVTNPPEAFSVTQQYGMLNSSIPPRRCFLRRPPSRSTRPARFRPRTRINSACKSAFRGI